MTCSSFSPGRTAALGLTAALFFVACGPVRSSADGGGSMNGDESALLDTDSDGEESSGDAWGDEPAFDVEVVDALLVSTEGAMQRTSVVVHVEVSNLGVAPITSVQLRAFGFDGYFSRSSIVVQPANLADALPLAPGDTVELRFLHEEDGALFDCGGWQGPEETGVELSFAVEGQSVAAPLDGNVRCRIVD